LNLKGWKTDHGENYILKNIIAFILSLTFLGDLIKEYEVCETCNTHG